MFDPKDMGKRIANPKLSGVFKAHKFFLDDSLDTRIEFKNGMKSSNRQLDFWKG